MKSSSKAQIEKDLQILTNRANSFIVIVVVRTRFDLNPEQEQTQAHVVQTINLQRAGEKASLNLGPRSWNIALEGKSYTRNLCKKYPRTCPKTMISEYFQFLPFLSHSFVLYTMAFLRFSPSTCGLGVESPFSPPLLPFLESSILSWKAACSLFRYHLHINAARRLAGRHLMQR